MDKVAKYRESVLALITRYASEDNSSQDVDVELVVDVQNDHYQWLNVGWEGLNRVYRCIVRLDIKDGMEDREIATTSRASHASTNRSREILSWFGNEG